MGRVNDYGVVTVSKPCANVIVLEKDASLKMTVSFHHDPQAPSLVKSVRLATERGEGRFSDCFIMFLSLKSEINKASTQNVFSVVASCASVFLFWLSMGRPLRGAIEVGFMTILALAAAQQINRSISIT